MPAAGAIAESTLGRQSVDPVLALLARRRPDLTSAHFGVSCLAADDADAQRAGPGAGGRLGFSVPKRLLARAVDRNALKRVAREAWRHARWSGAVRPAAAMIKLRRVDPQWRVSPRAALKKAWRGELDELLRRLVARFSATRRSAVSRPSGQAPEPVPANPNSNEQ